MSDNFQFPGINKSTILQHVAVLIFLLTAFSVKADVNEQEFADVVLYAGKIATVSDDFDVVEALAIRNGKIIKTGTNEQIHKLTAAHTRKINLKGKSVIPGFIDSHSHPTSYGMHIIRPDLSTAKEIADILKVVQSEVRKSAPGQWITNSRIWNEEKLKEHRNPTRYELDTVSPANPVFLSRGHLGVVNTAALNALGITENSINPEGGRYERDNDSGKLTGRVYGTAMDGFRSSLPHLTLDQIMAAQRQTYKDMAAAGVTSVRSAGFGAGSLDEAMIGADELRGFLELNLRKELTLRTSVAIRLDPNQSEERLKRFFREAPVASGLGDDMLNIWGIKMVADGGTDLAYLREEYKNRPGFRGQLGGTFENFVRTATLAQQYGWRVATHALGDAGIDFVLDVYDAVNKKHSITDKRWSIEHGYFLHPEHYQRIRDLGLIVHPQTWHLYNLHRNFLANYPDKYVQISHPYRTLIEQGITIAGGMDWHIVKPTDIFFYMWVAITRQTADGYTAAYEERLTREEALKLNTIWAAHSSFDELKKGTLEAGKYADLVVLSKDYLSVPIDEIKDIRPLLTMVGGKIVFQDSKAGIGVSR